VRCTAAVATMQFAMRDIAPDFLLRYPKVHVVAHATDQNVDIVGENYDIAIRAHSDPLPDSTLVQRTLTPAPWLLFAGSAYLDAHEEPQTPKDLQKHASLFMMRTGVAPVWRLRHASRAKADVVIRLTPRLLSDDMIGLKQAAIAGLGIVALPGYVAREDVRSGALRRVLPAWLLVIPRSRLSFPTGRAFCHPSASSSIIWRQGSRRRSSCRDSASKR
jgi:DNA-binding transcriptional LysR family regulator